MASLSGVWVLFEDKMDSRFRTPPPPRPPGYRDGRREVETLLILVRYMGDMFACKVF